jgi:hypothetical protein
MKAIILTFLTLCCTIVYAADIFTIKNDHENLIINKNMLESVYYNSTENSEIIFYFTNHFRTIKCTDKKELESLITSLTSGYNSSVQISEGCRLNIVSSYK